MGMGFAVLGICGHRGVTGGLWEQGVGLLIDIQARQRHVLGSRGALGLEGSGCSMYGFRV